MSFKSKIAAFASVIMLACASVSCGEGDEENDFYDPEDYPEESTNTHLTASPDRLVFDADGETKEVTLRGVNGEVRSHGVDWITISSSSSTRYSLRAFANRTGSSRQGYFYFECGSSSVAISVYQESYDGQGGNQGGSGNDPDPNPGESSHSAPSTPTGLTASPEGPSSYPYAMLRWDYDSNATSYLIYRSTSSSYGYSQIGTSEFASYGDENVKYGQTYYYKVKATNSYGTSGFSDYAKCEFKDARTPGPVTYGNCTVSGTNMTIRWTVPKDPSFGTPTNALLRVRHPDTGDYVTLKTLPGDATSVTFTYTPWVDKEGLIYVGIILENENGTGGGVPKIYDSRNNEWKW